MRTSVTRGLILIFKIYDKLYYIYKHQRIDGSLDLKMLYDYIDDEK
jgi:hypothetical protein